MNIRLFLLFFSFSLLASCGGQKGNISLKVTNSFYAENTGFNGGLFIQGKKVGSEEEFSFALTSKNSVSLNLGFGTWNIIAVGWNSDQGSAPMEGDVFCGNHTIDLEKDTSISIETSKEKCSGDDFVGSNFSWPTDILPCGALYDVNDPSVLRQGPLPRNFCSDYPPMFQMKPKGMKFVLKSIPSGSSSTLESTCIPLTLEEDVEGFYHTKKLPTKIPLSLIFFQSSSCEKQTVLGDYHFKQGLDQPMNRVEMGFDAILSTNSASTFLAVPFPLSRRGTSSLVKEIPEFKCSSTNNPVNPSYVGDSSVARISPKEACFQFPTLDTKLHYVLQPGHNSIQFPSETDCNNISLSAEMTKVKCETINDAKVLELNVTEEVANSGTSPTISVKQNGNQVTYEVLIKNNIHHFNRLGRILGVKNQNSILKKSFGNNGDEWGGILDHVGDFFSPAIVGGIFWDFSCVNGPDYLPARTVTVWDEEKNGGNKTYQLSLSRPGKSKNLRRISITRLTPPLKTSDNMTLDFECGNDNLKTGSLKEEILEVLNDGSEREEKRLLKWSTGNIDNSWFEEYRFHVHIKNLKKLSQSSSFTRSRKFGPNQLKVESLEYFYHKPSADTSTGQGASDQLSHEQLHYDEYDIQGTTFTSRSHSRIPKVGEAPGSIFNEDLINSQINQQTFIKTTWSMETFFPQNTPEEVTRNISSINTSVEGFDVNFMSLNPETMRAIIFGTSFQTSGQ